MSNNNHKDIILNFNISKNICIECGKEAVWLSANYTKNNYVVLCEQHYQNMITCKCQNHHNEFSVGNK